MDIEASCLLLQKLGKKLESRKTKSEEKSISFKAQMERLSVIEKTLKQSRLKYIIINLFEMQRNGWPESRAKREGPKKLEAIRQDIEKEKEKLIEKNTRKSYYRDGYEDEYEEPQRFTYRKRGRTTTSYGSFAPFSHNEEEKEADDFDQSEVLGKVEEHLKSYMDGKVQPYDIFKPLKKHSVDCSELVLHIFYTLTHNSSLFNKINKDKSTFIDYIFNFGKEQIYDCNEIIHGVTKYIKTAYENEVGDNTGLDEVVAEIYIKGYERNYYNIEDISFFERSNEDMYSERIKLASKLLPTLSRIGVAKLKKFYAEKINPMIEATEEDYRDEEVIEDMKKYLVEDSKKGKEVDIGCEIMSGVLSDNKLSVSFF